LLIEVLAAFYVLSFFTERAEVSDIDNLVVVFTETHQLGMCYDALPQDVAADLVWYRDFPSTGRTDVLVINEHEWSFYPFFSFIDLKQSVLQDLRPFGGAVVVEKSSLHWLSSPTFLERVLRVVGIGVLFVLMLLVTTHAVRELFKSTKLTLRTN
jgi:hypothetical protein